MTKYRLRSNFNGTWDIQILQEFSQYSHEQGKSVLNTYWRFYCTYPTYVEAVKCINNELAKKAYVPIIIEPPFPDRDPTLPPAKRNFFKLLSNFS